MQKKLVMFDIDDTLFNHDLVEKIVMKHGYDYAEVVTNWDINSLDISQECKDEIYAAFHDVTLMNTLLPNAGGKEVVNYFYEKGYGQISITAREGLHTEATTAMMKRYYPEIEDIYFQGPISKAILVERLGVDIVIDDNPITIDDCLELAKPPKLFLISNAMTPHNKLSVPKYVGVPNVHIIRSLRELMLFNL